MSSLIFHKVVIEIGNVEKIVQRIYFMHLLLCKTEDNLT